MENTNILINKIPRKEVYKTWLNFTVPIHKLTGREIDVLSEMIVERNEIMSKVKESSLVELILNSSESRVNICNRLGINGQAYNNLLCKLKTKGIVNEGKINKKFIPNVKEGANNYTLVLNFKLV
jgi:hypothetical protein